MFHQWAERWVLADPERGWRGQCRRLFQAFYFSYREFLHKNCWERAATLSFSTIVSLIPLSVLFLSFLTVFWQKDDLKSFVETKLLLYLVPDEASRTQLWANLERQVQSADAFKFHPGVNIMAVVGLVVTARRLDVLLLH